jgi:hypothetical protein
MIPVKLRRGNLCMVEDRLIMDKLTDRKKNKLMQRLKFFKWIFITVMMVLLLSASAGPVRSAPASISDTFSGLSDPFNLGFVISYNVTGASAEKREVDSFGQVGARRTYSEVRADPNVSTIRVHGTASGKHLTGLSVDGAQPYPGKIIVSVSCGKEKKEVTTPIPVGSSPPYSFDVSVPVPAGSEGHPVNFEITAGMLYPNGYFAIRVVGRGGFGTKTTIPVTAVKITNCPGSLELLVGTNAKLNAAVSPDNATNKKVNWSVDNQAVASISSDGSLTAKAPGTVTVTASSAENPQIKDQCNIRVVDSIIPVTGIKIENCPEFMSPGETITLNATVSPPNATNQLIIWQYHETSGKLHSPGGGGPVLRVTAEEGPFLEVRASSDENIKIFDKCRIPVISVRIEPASLRFAPQVIEDGGSKSEKVSVIIEPPEMLNTFKHFRVIWDHTHDDLVQVVPHGDGTEATIIAFSPSPRDPSQYSEEIAAVIAKVEISDGVEVRPEIFDFIEVAVEFHPVEQVRIFPHRAYTHPRHLPYHNLDGGQELVMEAIVLPRYATDTRLEWSTTNRNAGELIVYPQSADKPFYAAFTAKRGLPVRQDTFIIVKSLSNLEITDYLELRSFGLLGPDKPSEYSGPALSEQERNIIEKPRQDLPEDYTPTISADFSYGVVDNSPILTWDNIKEALWYSSDYLPYKSFVNAVIELNNALACLVTGQYVRAGQHFMNAIKDTCVGLLGPALQVVDHFMTYNYGPFWSTEWWLRIYERREVPVPPIRQLEQIF